MANQTQHNSILLAVIGFAAVVAIVGLIGYFTLGKTDDGIQGQVEASEYRVSSKLPGRVVELRAKEGDYVHAGDTLAILEVPEVDAQRRVAEATGQATEALRSLTDAGARQEQIEGARQLWQQAKAAAEIAEKTFTRMQNLYDEGVISGQKRDEAQAAYKATQAAERAAKTQYEMARNGARQQEREMAASQSRAAQSAVDVVNSLLRERVQISQVEGEVSEVYPHVGELVGTGSPIMSISVMKDMWGTFNIREDRLAGLRVGDTLRAWMPAFGKEVTLRVYYMKDQGSYAVWKATKANGDYDLKTFEVRARPTKQIDGLRPGMSLVVR